jgi:hypothetical protein
LQGALKGGAVFDELILEKREVIQQPLADAPQVRETDHTFTVKMRPNLSGTKAFTALSGALDKYKGAYDKAKVKITPRSGRPKVTPIDMLNDKLSKQLFIYQEHVQGFKPHLKPCEDEIRMDLVSKMIACSSILVCCTYANIVYF